MPQYVNAADGRTMNVSGADIEAQYAADTMWTLVTEKPAPEVPEGDPTAEWTVAQLTAWAADNGVEVPTGPKPAVVEAVLDALAERDANQD